MHPLQNERVKKNIIIIHNVDIDLFSSRFPESDVSKSVFILFYFYCGWDLAENRWMYLSIRYVTWN